MLASAQDEEAFFHKKPTHDLVDALAASNQLTLFAGAGVSKDSGSPMWRELVAYLLADRLQSGGPTASDEERIRRVAVEVVKQFGPVGTASIVRQAFDQDPDIGPQKAVATLTSRIWEVLYGEEPEAQGPLLLNIARLALSWKAQGKDVAIVTTNFDNNIEQIVERDKGLKRFTQNGFRLVPFTGVAEPERRVIPVYHLNGLIPVEGEAQGKVILSERGFAVGNESYEIQAEDEWQGQILEQRFSDSTVLFVGSSVTDPLVVRVLAATANSGADRYATFAVQGYDYPEEAREACILGLEQRLLHLAVEPVRPDFFGQIPQLLFEVHLRSLERRSYGSASYRYGQRLMRWSKEWGAKIKKVGFVEAQHDCQRLLAKKKGDARRLLRSNRDESLKLELWVRRRPKGRGLWLWGSSETVWHSERGLHEEPIKNDSDYAAVKAFCSGHVDRGHLTGPSRWKAYLSLPIVLEGERWKRLPVGVINLLSDKALEESSLAPMKGEPDRLRRLMRALTRVGTQILDAGPEATWPN